VCIEPQCLQCGQLIVEKAGEQKVGDGDHTTTLTEPLSKWHVPWRVYRDTDTSNKHSVKKRYKSNTRKTDLFDYDNIKSVKIRQNLNEYLSREFV